MKNNLFRYIFKNNMTFYEIILKFTVFNILFLKFEKQGLILNQVTGF